MPKSDVSDLEPSELEARDERGRTVLMIAAIDRDIEYLIFLIERGSFINSQADNGETALMAASRHGNEPSVRVLLEKGEAKTHYQDVNGSTCLHLAVENGSMEVIQLLVSVWVDVHIKNKLGQKAIDTVPLNRDRIREYLLLSPVEKAGCLLRALAKEFQSLVAASEDFLRRESVTRSFSSSISLSKSYSGITSFPNSRRIKGSISSNRVHVTTRLSSSEKQFQTSVSALVLRFLDLRISLQHRVTELASDYGDLDHTSEGLNHSYSWAQASTKYQDGKSIKRADFNNKSPSAFSQCGDRLAEVQWCLEALSETCRIFSIIFPNILHLSDLTKGSVQPEINRQTNLNDCQWALGLEIAKNEGRISFRRKKMNSVKLSFHETLTPQLSLVMNQASFISLRELALANDHATSSPTLSSQNLLFVQVPELYEKHLATLNEDIIESTYPVMSFKRCTIS